LLEGVLNKKQNIVQTAAHPNAHPGAEITSAFAQTRKLSNENFFVALSIFCLCLPGGIYLAIPIQKIPRGKSVCVCGRNLNSELETFNPELVLSGVIPGKRAY
jgi:hypothetical protein